jgi:hypothetical protein
MILPRRCQIKFAFDSFQIRMEHAAKGLSSKVVLLVNSRINVAFCCGLISRHVASVPVAGGEEEVEEEEEMPIRTRSFHAS